MELSCNYSVRTSQLKTATYCILHQNTAMVPATLGNVGYPETPFNPIYWHPLDNPKVFVSVSPGFAPWQEHQATCNACCEHANQSYNRPIDDVDTFCIDWVSIGEFASLVGWCWINSKWTDLQWTLPARKEKDTTIQSKNPTWHTAKSASKLAAAPTQKAHCFWWHVPARWIYCSIEMDLNFKWHLFQAWKRTFHILSWQVWLKQLCPRLNCANVVR